jgi:RNA methyltransferase, TrmH family
MISKAQIKFIRSLDQKKFRRKHLLFIAEGAKVAHEILISPLKVYKIYATAQWLTENKLIYSHKTDVEVEEVSREDLEKISGFTTPQEVLLLVSIPEISGTPEIKDQIALAVESIRDPGNLGTMIRICDWYGMHQLFCSDDCADAYNPKTIQASMGSIARVEVVYTDLKELIRNNSGHITYAATLDGALDAHHLENEGPVLLIIGNEAHGISSELLSCVTDTIRIPRFGQAESLNASIAAAVLVDNLVRNSER